MQFESQINEFHVLFLNKSRLKDDNYLGAYIKISFPQSYKGGSVMCHGPKMGAIKAMIGGLWIFLLMVDLTSNFTYSIGAQGLIHSTFYAAGHRRRINLLSVSTLWLAISLLSYSLWTSSWKSKPWTPKLPVLRIQWVNASREVVYQFKKLWFPYLF